MYSQSRDLKNTRLLVKLSREFINNKMQKRILTVKDKQYPIINNTFPFQGFLPVQVWTTSGVSAIFRQAGLAFVQFLSALTCFSKFLSLQTSLSPEVHKKERTDGPYLIQEQEWNLDTHVNQRKRGHTTGASSRSKVRSYSQVSWKSCGGKGSDLVISHLYHCCIYKDAEGQH